MQQDHLALRGTEEYPHDAIARKTAAKLPKSAAQRTAERHSNRPAKFNQTKISAKNLPVFGWKTLQPIPHQIGSRP
jgi:hypothetical protein